MNSGLFVLVQQEVHKPWTNEGVEYEFHRNQLDRVFLRLRKRGDRHAYSRLFARESSERSLGRCRESWDGIRRSFPLLKVRGMLPQLPMRPHQPLLPAVS